MSKRHEEIVDQVILDWSGLDRGRIFKNHQGTAWIGKPMQTTKKDAIILKYPQKITFGMSPGSSDLIGWEMICIGEYIVPLICSIEVKTKASPKLTDEQINWLNNIKEIGGRAYVARETDDGYDLKEWEMK
jgi:hypothetical protein